jgi:hypothetical protein
MSMSVFSGQLIARTGRYKIWPVVGLTLMIIGIGLLSRVGVDTPYWRTALIMVLVGWGLGGNMQPLTLAVQNAMPPKDMGVATASATFFRQMGGTLGTAVFLSVLFSAMPGRIVEAFRSAATDPAFTAALRDPAVLADPANQPVLRALQGGTAPSLDDSSFLSSVDPVLARPILEGFASAMSTVFVAAAAVLVLGLFAVLQMKEVPLRAVSGVEARRADDSARAAAMTPGGTSTGRQGTTTDGPRPWRRMRPAGGDGARAVVTRGLPDPAPGPPSTGNGTTDRNGSRAAGSGGDGPPATVLPPAPPRLAAETVAAEDGVRSTPSGDGGPDDRASGHPASGTDADPRDRLLAALLPDPPRALAVLADAERARDAARRARRELDRAGAELVAQGLSPAQVCHLLELTDEEAPDRGGRHRSVSAPAGPAGD